MPDGKLVRCALAAFDWAWRKQFLPCGFGAALIVGLAWPPPGRFLGELAWRGWPALPSLCVVLIFVVSGLKLKGDDVRACLSARAAIGYGLLSILVLSPALALAPLHLTFLARELRVGLAVFCAMPTTLSSGVALVAQARGNAALALLLTVASNVLAVFTVPFTLSTMSICSIEDVASEVGTPFWFQLYMLRDRAFMTNLIVRGLGGSQTGVTSETDAVSRV